MIRVNDILMSLRGRRQEWIWGGSCLALLVVALIGQNLLAAITAGIGLAHCLWGGRGGTHKIETVVTGPPGAGVAPPRAVPSVQVRTRAKPTSVQPRSPSALVNEMMDQGRYAVLLRPEVLANLSQPQADHAAELLTQRMAMVRGGKVRLEPEGIDGRRQSPVAEIGPFFIDRHAVTNAAFQEFVDRDGYHQLELWAPEVRDALENFVDRTNHPGPRGWREGRHEDRLADHPVVGLSWYEADAFARWAGKRLPRDAEWIKAALSPRASMVASAQARRFPWGHTFAPGKANLWSAQVGQTVTVTDYMEGATSEGVCQMVGNVWEWTGDPLPAWLYQGELNASCADFKSLRGGAFDTCIESQASPLSASGDSPFARKHNIGFRCVLDIEAIPSSVVPVV